jgi:hypothetical protein
MLIVRIIGFTIAAVSAVGVFIFAAPEPPNRFQPIAIEGNQALIEQALADYEANFIEAGESIELQLVANGWVTRDLLFIQANQFDALSEQMAMLSAQTVANSQAAEPDERMAALLLIAVLTLIFHGATLPMMGSLGSQAGSNPRRSSAPHEADESAGDQGKD